MDNKYIRIMNAAQDVAEKMDTSGSQAIMMQGLTQSDASVQVSESRLIGYGTPGDEEIMWYIVLVIRSNDVAPEDNRTLFSAAMELLKMWYRCAVDYWENERNDEGAIVASHSQEDYPHLDELGERYGNASITIFGDIVSKDGNSISLKITEKAQVDHVYDFINGIDWLYSASTMLNPSDGHEIMEYDAYREFYKNTRWTKVMNPPSRSRSQNKISIDTSRDDVETVRYISEINSLEFGTDFRMAVSHVNRMDKSVNVYGFRSTPFGDKVNENSRLYFYYDSAPTLEDDLKELPEETTGEPVAYIVAKKAKAKSGKPFWIYSHVEEVEEVEGEQ